MKLEKIKANKELKDLFEFGILNIDKPSGPTSFDISDLVRKRLKEIGVRKSSHFGTLDPKVTGVLPIALNRACKLTGYFLGEDKEYVGVMRIHKETNIEGIKKVIKENFSGKIKQLPPVRSRVKRAEREREIMRFEILEQDGKDFLFISEVQGGTYIRKLISDLGDVLGCGAHMLELRRIRAGIFIEDDKKYPSVNLYDLDKAIEEYKKGNEESLRKMIIPAEIVSEVYRVVEVKRDNLDKFFTGKPIYKKDLFNDKDLGISEGEKISVFCEDNFVGMYNVLNEKSGQGIFAKAEYVLQPIR